MQPEEKKEKKEGFTNCKDQIRIHKTLRKKKNVPLSVILN